MSSHSNSTKHQWAVQDILKKYNKYQIKVEYLIILLKNDYIV